MAQIYKVFFNEKSLLITDDKFFSKARKVHGLDFKNIQKVLTRLSEEDAFEFIVEVADVSKFFYGFCKSLKVIRAAGGLVQNDDGKLLMIYRHNMWDLPKGKMEFGETIEQTALREVEEETGAKDVVVNDFLASTYHAYQIDGKWVLKESLWFSMYSGNISHCKPQISEDITEVRWVDKDELITILPRTYLSLRDLLNNYIED